MIVLKAIDIIRDKNGKKIGYILVDFNDNVKRATKEEIKAKIVSKEYNVINLKLTEDNRLVHTKYKCLN